MRIRRLLPLIILVCLLLVAAGSYIWLDRWQRQTIFSVELGDSRWWREAPQGTEVFDITLKNGEKIHSWYIANPNPQAPSVLYLHGSRWNLNGSVFRIERWLEMGFSVLAIDYRGFGESSHVLPSQGTATQDANAALQELARRQPDPARRFVYGHSLGGAVAVALAVQADQPEFAGLILESTFTSIESMIGNTRYAHIPGLAMLVTQPFNSIGTIQSVKVPILFLHGTADSVVPHSMSDALRAAAEKPNGPLRRVVKIEGASHSGASRSGEAYENAIREFIAMGAQAKGDDGLGRRTATGENH
ncbi:alpha/beta fold hydrolase [Candidimonas sp. SYP-B2681]|uniref:alpha/beta hydrolase n=1 Tax=Candidimonas sp. SYP-B2681 TaxID=2497686 RepID=UPI000F87B9AC|nr:alpha/beta fold hydrolase [Candidimonas sp. SYP-B2681]RTZ44653.1 alpha/beta fold hydrolase [Candidimonas sp. SYP-B2681]